MIEPQIAQVLQVLRNARQLIEDPNNWIAGSFRMADRYSAIGALAQATLGFDKSIINAARTLLINAAGELYGWRDPISVNDAYGHRGAMAMFDHAIAAIEAAGSRDAQGLPPAQNCN